MATVLTPAQARLAMYIGARITMAREMRGLTKRQLARALDCTDPFIGRMEAGTRLPSIDLIYRIASYLDVPIKALLP